MVPNFLLTNKQGFCASYAKVIKFEKCAAVSHGYDIPIASSGSSIHFVADNVDHDICTLDGRGTFHAMVIITAVTPSIKKNIVISRHKVTIDDIKTAGNIRFQFYPGSSGRSSSIQYKRLHDFSMDDIGSRLDLLRNSLWFVKTDNSAWSGFMEAVHHGEHKGKSTVMFMPMLDYNPTDISGVYSTLLFIADQAMKLNVTPVVTFDQPLYYKAIIAAEPENSQLKEVVMLGCFHTRMSYLGAIGFIMADSGLSEVLEQVYACNSVKHMLTCKAIARATRGNILVESALSILLIASIDNVTIGDLEMGPLQDDVSLST